MRYAAALSVVAVAWPATAAQTGGDYLVGKSSTGLGIAVDLASSDETGRALLATLADPQVGEVATVSLVNTSDRGRPVPILFAEFRSGRVAVFRDPAPWLTADGRRWWSRSTRVAVMAPGGAAVRHYVVRGVGEPVVRVRAWSRGTLVATLEPEPR